MHMFTIKIAFTLLSRKTTKPKHTSTNRRSALHNPLFCLYYESREYYRSMLSEETLKRLEWYNSLSEEEQLAVSYEP